MPTVSLRLSDAELEELRLWARGSRRSLQREIVFRLFDGALTEGEKTAAMGQVGSRTVASPESASSPSVSASVQPVVQDVPMERKTGCGFDTPRGTKCKLCGKVH